MMAFLPALFEQRFGLSKRQQLGLATMLVAVLYYVSARSSLLLAFEGTNASPVWPPSGIALAALLLFGRKMWPAIAIGAFSANLTTFSAHHVLSLSAGYASFSIAIGNTLEALAGFQLLQYLKIADAPFEQPQSVFKFLMTTLLMCTVSATIGTASVVLSGMSPAAIQWPIWINWWLGDVGGIFIFTPLILTWLPQGSPIRLQPLAVLEMVAALAGSALFTSLIFGGVFSIAHIDRLMLYLYMPYLALIAYRYRLRGITAASLLLGCISVWGTTHGLGPFATGDLNNSLILLVSFIALYCVAGLILASDMVQRTQSKQTPVTLADIKIPWLTLLAALGLTIFAWNMVSRDTEAVAEKNFNAMARDTASDIEERMADYEQLLLGGMGLFAATREVTRFEWTKYAQQLDIEKRLPGVQSFAYAEWVNNSEKAAYTEQMRKESIHDYTVFPAGERQDYVPIKYIEPVNWRNQRAVGYDMLSEAVRRSAILSARDTGKNTISGKIRLIQEAEKDLQFGFVMYSPVYRNGASVATVADRRAALLGFVCSGFRMGDLMRGILSSESRQIGLEIFDGKTADPNALMFASAELAAASPLAMRSSHKLLIPMEFGNHHWTMRITSLPVFEATIDRQKAQIILVSGVVVSLLLFILVRSLAMTRESALALADEMTTALRYSEAKLRLLNSRMELAAEAGGIGVWDWDIQADYLTWDNRMYEIYRIDPTTADNNFAMWRERLHPDDLAATEAALEAALMEGRPFAKEFCTILPDGQLRRIKANAIVIRNEAGEPQHMIGINLDITELRQTEESLRASEERFRGVFEHSPMGMAIVSLDGPWLDVNGAICDILGYSEEELKQTTFQKITHPDDLEPSMARVEDLLSGKVDSYHLEKRYIRKDGEVVWTLLTVALMRDEHNQPLYFLSQIMNITDQMEAAAKLQSMLSLQSAILSSSNLSMIATDNEGNIVSFNRAARRMLQYSEDEVIGRQVTGLIHDQDEVARRASTLTKELGRLITPSFEVFAARPREGYADEHEWTYIRRDGTRFPVQLSVTAIRDETGAITGFLGVAGDITERKQREQAIAAALAEKEVLLKEVYHRVKNNLQVITSLFNLQLRALPEGPARAALKESVARVRAMALVHEKLYQSDDLSSIRLDIYILDLCHQLGSAAAAAERGIRLITEAEPIEIRLELAVPLGLLLNELVSNSLKHGFPNGLTGDIRIKLARLEEDKNFASLEVMDNGVGLSPGWSEQTRPSLGLKLVNTLSAQMDGVFRIESDHGTHASLIFRIGQAVQQEQAYP